jgi:hypothetical protein
MVRRTWRNGLSTLAATLLLAAGGLVATAPTAAAAPTSAFYMIVNDRTGKCVDVPDSSHRSGDTLAQWPCRGRDNQRWAPIDEHDGFFALISMNTPSLCLTIGIDFLIKQTTCDFQSREQRWQWGGNGSGQLVLLAGRPGNLCLGLHPNTEKDGTGYFPIPCSNTDSANLFHWQF